ncbi:MAG: PGF-CTERM sorting domain-containing protein [Methanomicrobiales archaeon]|nr:PGF-CTERM sorting domain-containing protein [Methanomicrobiales archaeon]
MHPVLSGKPIFLVILILLSGSILVTGCLKESRLAVTGMDVKADSIASSSVRLNVTSSVTSQSGFGSGDLTFVLEAYDTDTGLVAAERADKTGGLGKGQTARASQTIDLPRSGSYRLVVTIFEGQMQKTQGELTVRNLERLPTDRDRAGVEIQDIDFIVKGVSNGRAIIVSDIYFTNEGRDPSGAYDVEVRAREMDAHLIADKQWTRIDSVKPDATVIKGVELSVPDQYNYVVEVLLWQDQVIMKRGEGTVLLRPGSTLAGGEYFVTKKIETSQFIPETPLPTQPPYAAMGARAPGFGIVAALAGLGGALFMRRRVP